MRRGGRRPHAGRPSRLLLAWVLVLAAGAGCRGIVDRAGGPAPDAGIGTVVAVIDGDTVDVRVGGTTERVRLIGVDTPESVAPERPVQCFGAEAADATRALLPEGTEVRLERDEVTRDRYGRLLAYIWRTDDETLVNVALVEGGFADAVTFGDNEAIHGQLVAAESRARAAGTGLWGACGGPDVDIGPPPGE